jgi:16S rRNA (uracil1498-N3)-methyltransferase
MGRFFVNRENISKDRIIITGEDVKHIKNVLRLRIGDNLLFCDGMGLDYHVKILEYKVDAITTEILSSEMNKTEPPIDVILYQGMPKSDKLELIIQKCVELGVKNVIPVITDRTIVRLETKKDAEKKVGRWQKIATEAAKQCNRGAIPEIGMPVGFEMALNMAKNAQLSIIPYEKETNTVLKRLITVDNPKKIAVFIGPEGGFTEEEIQSALAKGTRPVTLGPRILRTETAGIAVLSILMYELGDIGIR